MSLLVAHEAAIRLGAFAVVLALCALAERRWPVRGDARPAGRQLVNVALVVANTAMLRVLFPVLAVGLALRGGGLLHAVAGPAAVEVALGVVALDLAVYWQHRLLHRIPLLWPLHRVHHTDLGIDVTTGVRFHPLEIALSMGIKLSVVALFGPPAAAVVLFEVLLSAGSLWQHTDVALPAAIERMARAVVVTPSLHRIHHSVQRDERDANYGFTTSLWDRVFGSLRGAAREPEATMRIGVPGWHDPSTLGFGGVLVQPFGSCDNRNADA